jgi:hypothetical protein
MTEFEDNLWLEIVREHGAELASGGRPVRKQRWMPRPQLLAGTTIGLATMTTAAVLLLGASTSPAAFAVTRNPDGTVTVKLLRPSGVAGANQKLAAMGVRAQIVVPMKTPPKLVCPGGTAPTITLDPASIPSRQVVMITPAQPNTSDAEAVKGTGGIPGAGNQVVHSLSPSSKIRTQSRNGNHVARMYCP